MFGNYEKKSKQPGNKDIQRVIRKIRKIIELLLCKHRKSNEQKTANTKIDD